MQEDTSTTVEGNLSSKESEIELSDGEIISIVNTKYNGLLRVLTRDNDLVVTKRPLILAFHNFKKLLPQLEPWCNVMAKIAKKYEERIDFAIADFSANLSFGSKLNKFNYKLIGPKAGPRIYAFDLHNNHFRMEKFLGSRVLIEFIESLLAGELFISQSIHEVDVKKHIRTAVGLNLKEIVLSAEEDILLLFYERWTRTHCALTLLDQFEELARLLQHEDLLIVKMDVEDNHVPPEFNISSYPRCIFIQKADKTNYIPYEQETLTIESLIEFIATHSTTELKCCDRNGMLKEELGQTTELHLESIENIISFLKDNYNDHIRVLTDAGEIKHTEKPLVVAFHNYIKYNMQLEPWYDLIEEVANNLGGKIDYAIADISLFSIDNLQFEFDKFNAKTQPWIYAFSTSGTQYKMKEYFSIEALTDFSHKLLHDELYASELLSVKNNEPLVKVATTENFRELVLDSVQNVFIAIYAPWCCCTKSLIPSLDHLANLLKEDKDQLVVKINGTVEKPPQYFRDSYYPRCFYIRKGEDKRHNRQFYGYPNSVENLIQFIAKLSSTELKYYDRDGFLRREYMRPCKELLCVDRHVKYYSHNDDIKKYTVAKHKLGNVIRSVAFEGLLQLRDANEEESIESIKQ